ncbi:MAG: AMP-binding enzyme [Promethearchaeota archaeon]
MKIGKVGVKDVFREGDDEVNLGCLYPCGREVKVGDPVPVEWFGFAPTCSFGFRPDGSKFIHVADNRFVGIKERPMYPLFDALTGKMLVDEDGDEVDLVDEFSEFSGTRDKSVGPIDIEQVILEHPKVEEVGVVVSSDEGGRQVKAFVKLLPGEGAVDEEGVRDELVALLRERFEDEYIPGKFVFLPFTARGGKRVVSIPKTSTGKVKRRELKNL